MSRLLTEFDRGLLVQAAWAAIHGNEIMREEFLRQVKNNAQCFSEIPCDLSPPAVIALANAVYFAGTGYNTRLPK